MAARGRTNSPADNRPLILALDCPTLEQPSSSRRRASPTRAERVPSVQLEAVTNIFNPCILTVHAGEDIGETIRAFFEGNMHNLQSSSKCMSMEGRIFTISGDVSNPRIDVQGSATTFQGIYSIATLHGSYSFHGDGHVQQDHLNLSFQPGDWVLGGSVDGPLIAGCEVQVTVGYVRLNGGRHSTIRHL